MRTVNKVILLGNVTKDPYVKTTQVGRKIVMFTVATNHSFKNARGESLSESEFTNCTCWGTLADKSESFLAKGKLVYVEGHLKTRALERDDGSRTYKTEVVVDNLIMLTKREGATEGVEPDEYAEGVDSIDSDDRF